MAKAKKTTKKTIKDKRPLLKVEKREITGRKVKKLRQDDLLPASLYGREIESINLQAPLKEVEKVFDKVGETGVVDLTVKGSKKKRPVLLKNPQYDPISDILIHLDFHQVDLTKKVTAAVPVELAGESPAAKSGEGVLVRLIDEIEIEALPTDLPEKFIVDVTGLKEVEDAVTVADLKINKDKLSVELEDDQVVAKVEPLMEEIEEEAPPVETEVVEGGPKEEGEEGEAEGKAEAKPEGEAAEAKAGKSDQKEKESAPKEPENKK